MEAGTIEDAMRLLGWAVRQVARGRLDQKSADGIMKLLKEFRELIKLREPDLVHLSEGSRLTLFLFVWWFCLGACQ